jgi:hypothetical protein
MGKKITSIAGGIQAPGALGKGSGAPTAPDFTAAAEAQARSGQINTPFGTWNGQNLGFAGPLQQGAEGLMGQIAGQGALPTGDAAREQAIQAAYGSATSRLDPMFGQREESLQSQLANQGLDPGSEAYGNAMGSFGRERTDAYTQALASAIGQGTQAGNAIFQQGLQGQMAPYQQLGALAGLLRGNQGPQTQYLNAANAGYQGALQGYGIDQAGKNSQMAGASQLASMAALASDERLKVNIERSTLEAIPGVPFATWEWAHEPGTRVYGVIAQDLEAVAPEYVKTTDDGLKLVDYSFLDKVNHG